MLKKKLRRLSAILMAGVMTMSMVGTAFATGDTTPTDAPDYEATDTYALNYSNQDIAGYEDWDAKILYASKYRTNHSVTNHDGVIEDWWSPACVMNMINPALIDGRNADYPYASIGVYCVDGPTDAITGTAYRRVNLEEATYFDDETAGRVRAIMMDAFPYQKDMSVLTNKVNAWITENGLGDQYKAIQNLNPAEVMSSVQSVIWVLVNNGEFDSPVYANDTKNYDDSICVYTDTKLKATQDTPSNIESLVWYLMALEPMAPQGELISSASFEDAQVTYAEAADGTLTATVKATVKAEVKGATDLTLTAVCEGKSAAAVAVQNGTKTYTMTIEGLANVSEISLAIDGIQENGDVYLFDPVEGRMNSQTMAGYDTSSLPVHAETKIVEDERILNIHKIGKVENPDGSYETVDLANIVFDVCFVGTLEDYLSGKVAILDNPTAEGLTQVASLKTDKNGEASLNLTRKGLADGVYLVVEKQSAATTTGSLTQPFYVMLPYTSNSGDSWEYVVTAQPKNTLIGGPDISKDITKLNNDFDSFDVNEAHTWIITADKPADIADGIKYEITDVLDSRLDYVGNVKVTVEDEQGLNTVTLDPSTAYVASYDETSRTLTVSLTDAGMDAAAADMGNYIRVYFDSMINATAAMDEQIPNVATLEYTNSTNYTYAETSDDPKVVTGAFQLVKVDGNSKSDVEGVITYANKLAGAEFTLYREATETEIAAAAVEGATIKVEEIKLGDENGTVKKVIAIASKTSDENGSAEWAGLAYGTYYLVETKAPAGYNLLLHPEVVTIGTGTATTAMPIANFTGFKLPETGGIGTTVYTLMGSMTMAASGMYIFRKKRED